MAAAVGNQYAAKSRKWTQAIERALDKRSVVAQRDELDALAEVLITEAMKGEQWAIKELGDRLEGKPAQGLILTGEDGGPVKIEKIERVIVNGENTKA